MIVESLIETQPEPQGGDGEREGDGRASSQSADDGDAGEAARRPEEELQAGERDESGDGASQTQGGMHGGDRAQSAQASEGTRGMRKGEEQEVDARGNGAASADRTRGGFGTKHPLSEEQRLAYEQWLRRIPDDPGGLLRRKFALEYRARGDRPPSRSDAW